MTRVLNQFIHAILFVVLTVPMVAVVSADPALQKVLQTRIDNIKKDKQALQAAMATGREAAGFCVLCHGEDGNSIKADVPHLAEQNPVYLLDQIERFADGRRADYIMSPLAKKLTPDEKVALVIYYSSQRRVAPVESGVDPAVLVTGRETFDKHCVSCHGGDGKGKEGYAYIAALPSKYISSTLTHFREREKGRTNSLMSAVMQKLTNEQIDALAAYVSSLR